MTYMTYTTDMLRAVEHALSAGRRIGYRDIRLEGVWDRARRSKDRAVMQHLAREVARAKRDVENQYGRRSAPVAEYFLKAEKAWRALDKVLNEQ